MFGGLAIQPVQTEKLRVKGENNLFYPPGTFLSRQAFIWCLSRVFFAVFANCLEFKVRVRACRIREI
jgi:hypothetical protein